MGIPRGLAVLAHLHHRTGSPLAAMLGLRLAGFEHALFEILTGTPPPGDGKPLFSPHTHDGEGSVAIPRGTIYSYDWGDQSRWAWTGGVAAGYWRNDGNAGAVAATSANDGYPPNLWIHVSDGIGKNSTAVSGSPCAVEAQIYASSSRIPSGLRLRNRTAGEYGSVVMFSAANTYEWVELSVPVVAGRWNAIDVESYNSASSLGFAFDISSCAIAERRSSSQPDSSGAHTMSSAPKP